MKKKAFLIAAALAGASINANAQSGELPVEPLDQPEVKATTGKSGNKANEIERTKIIESLQQIRKDPTTVQFHSAMCYDMVMPPPDTTFTCPYCGNTAQYSTQSFAGKVADWMPSIDRTLALCKVKMEVDYSDFCPKCRKDEAQPRSLKFVSYCLDCGEKFGWSASGEKEIEQLSLLAQKFPIKEIDQGEKGSMKIEPEKLSQYISNRFLCPKCREKHGLK
jgi:ribosomal protein L37AE/L43A